MVVELDRARPKRPDEALHQVIRHIRPLHRALAKSVADNLEGTGINLGVRAVLVCIHDGGPQTVPQITRTLGFARQFIQRIVNNARKLGLVERVKNPAHRRSSLLALTKHGQDTLKRIHSKERRVLRATSRRLKTEDIEACLRVLRTLISSYGEPEGEFPYC